MNKYYLFLTTFLFVQFKAYSVTSKSQAIEAPTVDLNKVSSLLSYDPTKLAVQFQKYLEPIKKVVPAILPIEDFRGSGFLLSIPELSDQSMIITAGHVVKSLILSEQKSKKVQYSLKDYLKANQTKNELFFDINRTTNLIVEKNQYIMKAQLLFFPQNLRSDLINDLPPPVSDFALAVIKSTEGTGTQLIQKSSLKIAENINPNEELILIGFPGISQEDRKLGFTAGRIISDKKATQLSEENFKDLNRNEFQYNPTIEIDTYAEAIPGMSGGLALNLKGEVIGIIEAGYVPANQEIPEALQKNTIRTRVVLIKHVIESLKKDLKTLNQDELKELTTSFKLR